jgi:hypothetical protein
MVVIYNSHRKTEKSLWVIAIITPLLIEKKVLHLEVVTKNWFKR